MGCPQDRAGLTHAGAPRSVPTAVMHVLICDPISPRGIAYFQARPEFRVTVLSKRLTEAELLPLVADADALVVRSETKVSAKVLAAATQLKVVGRAGVGVDNVDVEAATQRGVVVMNTPAGNTLTTAEMTFFMLGGPGAKDSSRACIHGRGKMGPQAVPGDGTLRQGVGHPGGGPDWR